MPETVGIATSRPGCPIPFYKRYCRGFPEQRRACHFRGHKENIGNFKNNSSEYRPKKSPRQVLDHDFPIPELGKVAPYGVYVLNDNTGFINLGISHDTPEFAGKSVYHWWQCVEKNTFPKAKRLYITCDGGGSNGSRVWLRIKDY